MSFVATFPVCFTSKTSREGLKWSVPKKRQKKAGLMRSLHPPSINRTAMRW